MNWLAAVSRRASVITSPERFSCSGRGSDLSCPLSIMGLTKAREHDRAGHCDTVHGFPHPKSVNGPRDRDASSNRGASQLDLKTVQRSSLGKICKKFGLIFCAVFYEC